MCSCIDTWLKLVPEPINPSTNTRKIVKLCVDVYGYGYGYVNASVVDSASIYGNGNVADCANAHEKIFLYLLTKPNGCAIMTS